MKRVEISYMSIMKELEKLNTRLEKAEARFEKKQALVEKLGCAWTDEEHREWLKGIETNEVGFLLNKADIKKNGTWFDWCMAQNEVEEIKSYIQNAEKRLGKKEQEVENYHKEVAQMEDLKAKEELQKLEFEQEQKEWAKDGIQLNGRYHGITPNGKRFMIEGNNGWTDRSRHCFTLTVDGKTIFTSGEFWRAYNEVKNR